MTDATQYNADVRQILRSLPGYEDFEIILKDVDRIGREYLAGYNTKSRFNIEGFRKLGEIGLFAMSAPNVYGGLDLPFPFFVACLERLAYYEPGSTLGDAIHDTAGRVVANNLVGMKEQYYNDMIHGRKVAAFALTENGSGSDARNSVRTTYKRCDDGFALNGEKLMITNGCSADLIVVIARDADNPNRLSAFLAEANDGAGLDRTLMKGKNSVRTSETASLVFDGYRIPGWSLIGQEGEGFKYFLEALSSGRLTIAGIANGISRFVIDKTVKYAESRDAFGHKLIDIQAHRGRIDAMEEALGYSRLITYRAASLKDQLNDSKKFAGPAAVAKFVASETSGTITNESIEMCGGHGILKDGLNMARDDTDICRIGEGANGMLITEVIPLFADDEWKGFIKKQEELNRKTKPRLSHNQV